MVRTRGVSRRHLRLQEYDPMIPIARSRAGRAVGGLSAVAGWTEAYSRISSWGEYKIHVEITQNPRAQPSKTPLETI